MFRRTTDDQQAITHTWADVDAAIGSLKGRKFYGAFSVTTGEYWVCVQLREVGGRVSSRTSSSAKGARPCTRARKTGAILRTGSV